MPPPRALGRFTRAVPMAFLAVAALAPFGAADARTTSRERRMADQAVAYQIDVAHSGSSSESLVPPLAERWRVRFKGGVSYPLVAEGRVFVTSAGDPAFGTWLQALDATTGAGLWRVYLHGEGNWSNAAYESGRVFAVTEDGMVRAFDAATGTELWHLRLSQYGLYDAPPTVWQGILYVSGGQVVVGIDAVKGRVLWNTPVGGGDQSSPTVSDDGVYVSYSCPLVYKLDRFTGGIIWTYDTGCHGGGGRTAVYHGGRLYVRDETSYPAGYLLDAADGTLLSKYFVDPAPAFSGNLGFFLSRFGGALQARTVPSARLVWEFSGDGDLSSAPIVVNGWVYIGSGGGVVYALDASTGEQAWSTDVGRPIPQPDEFSAAQPLTGLGAGEGLLFVPAGRTLVAFGPTG